MRAFVAPGFHLAFVALLLRDQVAYFDVRFANVNAESYKDLDTATIFAKREKSKKRDYGERVGLEHATFTALIFGTMVVWEQNAQCL